MPAESSEKLIAHHQEFVNADAREMLLPGNTFPGDVDFIL